MSATETQLPPDKKDSAAPSSRERFAKNDHGHESAAAGTAEASGGKRKMIGLVVAVAVVAGASYFGYQSWMFVTTDNAQVQGKTTLLSSRVTGLVVAANVEENQKVKAGDVLVEIKPDDYQNVVDSADSERASLEAEVKGAELNYKRAVDLFAKGASTQERLDSATAQYHSLQERLKMAAAQVASAKLNVGYTKVIAPADGKVGRKSFEVGMLAGAGMPLLGFVEGRDRWVVANLKETDMDHIREGREAEVEVDAISGRTFKGVVESISPTTGATFSLLPPDNATGNFTKVVQRVPVRIKLTNLTDADIDRLQSGLSAVVKIRVH